MGHAHLQQYHQQVDLCRDHNLAIPILTKAEDWLRLMPDSGFVLPCR